MPADEGLLEGLMKTTEQRLGNFMRSFNIRSLPTQPLYRLKLRNSKIDPTVRSDPAPVTAKPTPASATTETAVSPVPPTAPVDASTAWSSGIDRLQLLINRPGQRLSDLFSIALGTVAEGFQAPEAAVFASRPNVKGFALADSRGTFARNLSPAPIRADERTVFGICLSRRENVLIHNAEDPKIIPYLPAWLRRPGCPRSFVLLPLYHQDQVHGLILTGWPTARQIAISAAHATLIRTMLGLIAQMCARSDKVAA
jgi:hypothetical protein